MLAIVPQAMGACGLLSSWKVVIELNKHQSMHLHAALTDGLLPKLLEFCEQQNSS